MFDGIVKRLDTAEERISELKDISKETSKLNEFAANKDVLQNMLKDNLWREGNSSDSDLHEVRKASNKE